MENDGKIDVSEKGFRGGEMGIGDEDPGREGEGIHGLGKYAQIGGGPTYPTGNNTGGAGGNGVSNHCGNGGGGGGYATQGGIGNAGCEDNPSFGGYSIGFPKMNKIFFGGAGGGGGDDDDFGSNADGGDSGGIIVIASREIIRAKICGT